MDPPGAGEPPDDYLYDPANPVPSLGGSQFDCIDDHQRHRPPYGPAHSINVRSSGARTSSFTPLNRSGRIFASSAQSK